MREKAIADVAGTDKALVAVTCLALAEVHARALLAAEVPLEHRVAVGGQREAALHKHVLLAVGAVEEQRHCAVAEVLVVVRVREKLDAPEAAERLELQGRRIVRGLGFGCWCC